METSVSVLFLAWFIVGFVAAFMFGYAYAWRSLTKSGEPSADIVMKAVVKPDAENPVDFRVDHAFVENAPIEFLIQRGQTREQFAEQVAHAMDEVRAEGYTDPAVAMHAFAKKIGVRIDRVGQASPEEAQRVIDAQNDFTKRAN